MSGFMNPLMGGAVESASSRQRRAPGADDDPGNYFVRSILEADRRRRRNEMKIGDVFTLAGNEDKLRDYRKDRGKGRGRHGFDEAHQSGGDYEVGEGPAVSSGKGGGVAPRTRTAPGDASKTDPYSYLREEIDRTRRDQMKIDQDPTVQGVKTDKGKRRGGSGRSRGGKRGEGKRNYYEDRKSGTGVHT